MKKIIKLTIILSVLLLSMLVITSCSRSNAYATVEENGYNVSVRFDIGEGMFSSQNDLVLVNVFNLDNHKDTNNDGNKEIYLLPPDDKENLDQEAFDIGYGGHYFVGWYTERYKMTNENGEYIDKNGNVCSESEAAYYYGNRWDFSKPLEVSPSPDEAYKEKYDDDKYSAQNPVLTLYAAWIPLTRFEIYVPNDITGEYEIWDADVKDDNVNYILSSSLEIPDWNKETGKLKKVSKFPSIDGKTFDKAYYDIECTQPVQTTQTADGNFIYGNIDYEKSILLSDTVKIYTTWLDGTYYNIYNPQSLMDNASANGIYIIHNDLEFDEDLSGRWNVSAFATETFNGQLLSADRNNYKIKNLALYNFKNTESGGIFSSLGSSAQIKNITFENATYTVNKVASSNKIISFGLLAGTYEDGVIIENVSFTGESAIRITPDAILQSKAMEIRLGAVFGNQELMGIDCTNIFVGLSGTSDTVEIIYDNKTGYVEIKK